MAALPYFPSKPSTPPPSIVVNAPPAPRFGGFEDNWQPYGTTRITRSSKNRVAQTPPPPASPPTGSKKHTPRHTLDMRERRVTGAQNADSTATAAEASGLTSNEASETDAAPTRNGGMLITPAKTPAKRNKKTAATSGVARNLFSIHGDEAVMPTPKRAASKYNSFEGEPERPIPIFTDTQDRDPEIDDGLENPFYGPGATKKRVSKKQSKRSKKGKVDEEKVDHSKGMYYCFRGKKTFRAFAETEPDSPFDGFDDQDARLGATVPPHLREPLDRASIEPRLLFSSKPSATESDEEASTDIEESMDMTPKRQVKKSVSTPKAPKFAPFTPPTTVRTTRSKDVEVTAPIDFAVPQDVPKPQGVSTAQDPARKVSPFHNWKRTKHAATSHFKKREGEMITRGAAEVKKPRGERGHGHA